MFLTSPCTSPSPWVDPKNVNWKPASQNGIPKMGSPGRGACFRTQTRCIRDPKNGFPRQGDYTVVACSFRSGIVRTVMTAACGKNKQGDYTANTMLKNTCNMQKQTHQNAYKYNHTHTNTYKHIYVTHALYLVIMC